MAELTTNGSTNTMTRFVYGSRTNTPELMLKYTSPSASPTAYRIFSDHLGSPRVVVNASNANDVLLKVHYSAFGIPTLEGGSLDAVPMGFVGGLFDPDTTLVRFGARDYDARFGRWVSKEPLRFVAGTNFYVYSHNDSINWIDSDGNTPLLVGPWLWYLVTGLAVSGYDAWLNYGSATADTIQKYPPDTLHNGPGDAYKHCLASCMTAQDQGTSMASFWGWANEMKGDYLSNQPGEEKQMDYENNACGRSYRNSPDCAKECQAAIGMGVLSILNP